MVPHILEFIRHYVLTLSALEKFALFLVMLVAIPRLCRRAHVPAAVGLLLGGVLVGPYVLGFFSTNRPIADFLGELGKLLLMFFAGLEIDLALFRRVRNRSIAFGADRQDPMRKTSPAGGSVELRGNERLELRHR